MTYFHPAEHLVDQRMQDRPGLGRLQAIRELQAERTMRQVERRKTPSR